MRTDARASYWRPFEHRTIAPMPRKSTSRQNESSDQRRKAPGLQPGASDPCHQPTFSRSKSMTAGSKKSVAPSTIPQFVKTDVDRVLESGLADFSIRELLGLLLSNTGA